MERQYSDVSYLFPNLGMITMLAIRQNSLVLAHSKMQMVAARNEGDKRRDETTYRKTLHEKVLNIFNGKFSTLSNDSQRNGPIFSRSAAVNLRLTVL